MKVYFTCSTAEFKKHKKLYFGIRDFLVKEKHIITHDWLEETNSRIENGITEVTDIKQIYKNCMSGILESEAVIIEDTVSNFSTGHQITVALQRQKPTLVLWSRPKHRHFKQTFISGIESEFLEFYEYKGEEYKEIIHKFLKKYENTNQKNRFHLVLNEVERRYLDWAQFNKDKSRTKIIRESLMKFMNEDEEFQKFLEKS